MGALAQRPWTVLAGGTDHYPARGDMLLEEDILDVSGIDGFRHIEASAGHWFIPCGATWSDVIAAELTPQFDGLVAAARQVGGRQVQNAGTVMGNLCNASPAADGIPCLLALDAEVMLASMAGERVVHVQEFVTGPRATVRRPDELAVGLRVKRQDTARSRFLKLGAREYLVISIAMVAVVAEMDGPRVASARVAVGACGPMAIRLPALEAALAGQVPVPELVAADMLADLAPIDDIRGTAAYRRLAALQLVRRAVSGLVA